MPPQKTKMKAYIIYISFFASFSLSAQNLFEAEKALSALFETLKTTYARDECLDIHTQIETTLQAALQADGSFEYPFDSLAFLGKVYSDDHLLRIYSWNVPFYDGTFHYGCIIQQKQDNALTVLKIREGAYAPPPDKYLAADNWYGALYFRAIPVAYRKKHYYTLLGWAGNDDLTNLKMIDVLTFDSKGVAQFGSAVFKVKNKTHHRIVFEYGDQYTMSLDYDMRKRQIVFDHLAPSAPKYEGLYTHYGPDFSYDAFRLKKSQWILEEDVDARNEY